MQSIISGAMSSAVAAGGMILIAGIGELLAERTGVINIGIEGIMAMGAVTSVLIVNSLLLSVWVGLLGAALVGLALGMLFATVSVGLKANQLLVGLALAFLGDGVAQHIGQSVSGLPALDWFRPLKLPLLGNLPVIGSGLFNQNILVYCAYLVLPLVAYVLLNWTRHGIAIRTGRPESRRRRRVWRACQPTALLLCLVRRYAVRHCRLLCRLYGLTAWTAEMVSGQGWIAITLVFFSQLNPWVLAAGALLFGGAASLGFFAQIKNWGVNGYFLGMLPYVVTILLVLVASPLRRRSRRQQTGLYPAALTLPYRRESVLRSKRNGESMPRELVQALADVRWEETLELAKQMLAQGIDPVIVLDDCREGMRIVGERFETGQYFSRDLVMSGEILREVTELVRPLLKTRGRAAAARQGRLRHG